MPLVPNVRKSPKEVKKSRDFFLAACYKISISLQICWNNVCLVIRLSSLQRALNWDKVFWEIVLSAEGPLS